jgi:hypothetical protein
MAVQLLWHEELQEMLDLFYRSTKRVSVMLEGTFGIGKTRAMRDFAKKMAEELKLEFSDDFADVNDESKFSLLVFVLHHYEPGEFKGIPYADKDRQYTIYLPMKNLPVNPNKKGILFIDEINSASDMLRKNAYQLIEDRKLGMYKVPQGVLVCGAGNLDSDRCGTYEMEMALNNRFLWAQLQVPKVDDIEVEYHGVKRIVTGWIKGFAVPNHINFMVQNYLVSNKQHLYTYKPDDPNPEKTQATPRIWEKISEMLELVKPNDYWKIETVVSMGAGTGIGNSFVSWLKLKVKYDIPKIYRELKVDLPQDVALRYSLISGLIGHYLEQKGKERAVALTKLARMFSKEYTLMILNQVKNSDADFFKNLKAGDPKLYSGLADGVFPFLI